MINDQEQWQALQDLNQARQALGKQVDLENSLAMASDLSEIERIAKQFPELDYENFRRAISESLITARRVLSEGNFKLWDININPIPEVRSQLNLIQRAINAGKVASTPQLQAAKPAILSGDEWLAQAFPDFYASGKFTGTFAPIWAKNIFGDDLPQLTAIRNALSAHPDFHEGAQDVARREAISLFISAIYATAKADGINPAKLWHEPGQTFQAKPERDLLTYKIDEHNATTVAKFSFKVETEWLRCRAMAAIHAYARLTIKPESKQPATTAGLAKIVTKLEDVE